MLRWLWRVVWTVGLGLLLSGIVSALLVWYLPPAWHRPGVVAATVLSIGSVALVDRSRRRRRRGPN